MKKQESRSSSPPGATSLMVIFAVLCLVVFAVLAMSTVLADGRIADASISAVRSYYAAAAEAEEKLAAARAEGVRGETTVTAEIPPSRCLQVTAEVTDGSCSVTGWRTVYNGVWEPDESLGVWIGD